MDPLGIIVGPCRVLLEAPVADARVRGDVVDPCGVVRNSRANPVSCSWSSSSTHASRVSVVTAGSAWRSACMVVRSARRTAARYSSAQTAVSRPRQRCPRRGRIVDEVDLRVVLHQRRRHVLPRPVVVVVGPDDQGARCRPTAYTGADGTGLARPRRSEGIRWTADPSSGGPRGTTGRPRAAGGRRTDGRCGSGGPEWTSGPTDGVDLRIGRTPS